MTYHTVHTPRAIPPKPAPKVLAPKISMAEDAALVRIRANRAWGAVSESAAAKEANMRRAVEAQRRCEALCDRIMASLATPRHKADLARLLGVSEASIRQAVTVLSKAGRITWRRGAGGLAYWTAKEAGE